MKSYFSEFHVIEIQRTFYKIPRDSTLEKWRQQAPKDFEFTVKATQLITHSPTSPTYRKAKLVIPSELYGKYGFFRPTEQVFNAWKSNRDVCKILNAKICVFQTPKSFKPTDENIENIKTFFRRIDRATLSLGWEPRGNAWTPELVKEICKSLNLIHVTDPFKQLPTYISNNIAYLRLHGSPPGSRMYSYNYTRKDFADLVNKLNEIKNIFKNVERIYIMFNNIYMRENSKQFLEFLGTPNVF